MTFFLKRFGGIMSLNHKYNKKGPDSWRALLLVYFICKINSIARIF